MKDVPARRLIHKSRNILMVISGTREMLNVDKRENLTEWQRECLKRMCLTCLDLERMLKDFIHSVNKERETREENGGGPAL